MKDLDLLKVKTQDFDSAAAEWDKTHRIWVPNEKEGYVLATILQNEDSSGFCEVQACETGEKRRVSRDDINKVNPFRYYKCEDMATMSCLNEPAVLYNLKQRYSQDLIYTYSGLFCVVINPYKQLKIYSEAVADCFKGRKRNEMPPHIYAVADEAYRNMLQNKEDQSILCTGESGAGKTENTKKLIQYLSHVAGSRKSKTDLDTSSISTRSLVGQLEEQLLCANPILEAFGNSKTVRNDNSSRFGKFVRIHFDSAGYICGANIEFYLLEKSRVLRQSAQERSFHIFYQLIRGASKSMREELLLEKSPASYRFLTNGDMSIPGVDDAKELQNTMDAMSIMGFSEEETKSVFRVISALLLFGNLTFAPEGTNSDQARITNDGVLQKIAKLLHVNFDDLQKAILKPKIKINAREHAHRSQNEEQARFAVEAIAKATYERLFRWLVRRLNRSLDRTRQNAATFIGILDIAGFEIFDKNSFEQLCINYTNEKLQQLFNTTMFVREQQEYLAEGIKWDMIDFGLNLQPTIDLIDKPLGVLAMLDDVCLFPCGDDSNFVKQLSTQHQNHPKFILPEMRSKSDFGIVHYAGRVDYNASEWRMKNMDPLNENVVEVLQISKDVLVAEIWKDVSDMCKMASTEAKEDLFGIRVKKGLFRTVSQLYKEQLTALLTTLNNTNPHFVRCIIPNHEKKAGIINGPLVLEQLRCNGVLEGIRIYRQGFPNRIPFQEFRQRYGKLLVPEAIPHDFIDGREAAKRIVTALDIDSKLHRIGQSKIFFRSGVVAELEILRDQKLAEFGVLFQAVARGFLARKHFQRMRAQSNAIRIIQRNGRSWMRLRNWNWWKLYTKVLPIVTANMEKEKIEEMESELVDTQEKLRKTEAVYSELSRKVEAIEEERDNIQQLYDTLYLENADAAEQLHRLANKNKEVNKQLEDVNAQLMSQEKLRRSAELKQEELLHAINDLKQKLAVEEDNKKRLVYEKETIEDKLKELEESKLGADESSAKVVREKQQLEAKYKALSERLQAANEKITELQNTEEKIRKDCNETKGQLQEAKIKLTTELAEQAEDLRRRHNRELQEANTRADDEATARIKAEKIKQKIEQESNDTFRENSDLSIQIKEYERKQRRFDQQIAEEKNNNEKLQQSVYDLEQQSREQSTRLLSAQNELERKNEIIEKLEKEKRNLRQEIESLSSNKDDTGKNLLDTERTKQRLEDELASALKYVEELEDSLSLAETEKQRTEVKYQVTKTALEQLQRQRDSDEDDGNRQLKQKLRTAEELLDEERRLRNSAVSAKTKIESEYRVLQDEVDAVSSENMRLKNKLVRLDDKYKQMAADMEHWKISHANELANAERMSKLYHKAKADLQTAEDDFSNETQKCRDARRQILDLEEKVDALSREVQQLQGRIRSERRVSLMSHGIGRSRYESSTSLNRVDETLGSEDSPRASSRLFADDDVESVLSYRG